MNDNIIFSMQGLDDYCQAMLPKNKLQEKQRVNFSEVFDKIKL